MISKIFSQDGFLWKGLNWLTDVFALSTLWLLCALPLVTLGAATTALYDAVVRCLRYRQPGPYRRFFKTFKSDILTSVGATLLWAVLIAFLVWVVSYLRYLGEYASTARIASVAYYVLLLIPIGAACWVFPLLSRFTFRFGALNLTALKFVFAHLPSTVVLVLLTVELLQLCLRWVFPLFFVPALMMLLWSLFIEPAFQKAGGGLAPDKSGAEQGEL